jgi:hypothetical protein
VQNLSVSVEGLGASAGDLNDQSFSSRLSHWRADLQTESEERPVPKKVEQKSEESLNEEERMTQYYRKVLNALVESNIVTDDMASFARGRRGMDLVAAIGVVLRRAEEQRGEANRARLTQLARQ